MRPFTTVRQAYRILPAHKKLKRRASEAKTRRFDRAFHGVGALGIGTFSSERHSSKRRVRDER